MWQDVVSCRGSCCPFWFRVYVWASVCTNDVTVFPVIFWKRKLDNACAVSFFPTCISWPFAPWLLASERGILKVKLTPNGSRWCFPIRGGSKWRCERKNHQIDLKQSCLYLWGNKSKLRTLQEASYFRLRFHNFMILWSGARKTCQARRGFKLTKEQTSFKSASNKRTFLYLPCFKKMRTLFWIPRLERECLMEG